MVPSASSPPTASPSSARLCYAESSCQLLLLPTHLCDPGRPVAPQTCGGDNQCIDLPASRSVGTVSLTGLVVPVEMTPNAITGRYRSKGARLAHPAYTRGARLGLHASNAAIEAARDILCVRRRVRVSLVSCTARR